MMKLRTVFKELIAMTLILAMSVCSSFALSEARDNSTTNENQTTIDRAKLLVTDYFGNCKNEIMVKTVSDDIESMKSIGIYGDNISINKVGDGEVIVYDWELSDTITNQLHVEESSDGSLTVEFFEDSIHDVIRFKNDGRVILNGKEVIFSNDCMEYEDIRAEARSSVFKNTPFKGKKSNYSKYIKNYTKNSVSAGNLIKGLATGTIATIISAALKLSLGGNIGAGLLAGLASNIKNVAETHAPDSAYLSYSVNKYEYPQNGGTDRYYRYTGKYYVKKNCKGYSTSHTFYEHNFFN